MPGRNAPGNYGYKYGFNGKEKDDEIKGSGNSLDFNARIYDPRIGRWLSTDPLMHQYPSYSPFNYSFNNPISFIDPDGESPISHIIVAVIKKIGKAIAKQMAPELAEAIVKKGMKAGMKDYASKGFYKRFVSDLSDAVSVFDDSWIETTIGIIPVLGDGYDIGKLIKNNPKYLKKLSDATIKFKKATDNINYALSNSNRKLRNSLNGSLKVGEQAHHLIPVNALKENDVVADAVAAGFDFNGSINGIGVMPVSAGGEHSKHDRYTDQITNFLNEWAGQAKKDGIYSPEAAKAKLEDISNQLKSQVEAVKGTGNKINEMTLDLK